MVFARISILRGSLRSHLRMRFILMCVLIPRCPAEPGLEGC